MKPKEVGRFTPQDAAGVGVIPTVEVGQPAEQKAKKGKLGKVLGSAVLFVGATLATVIGPTASRAESASVTTPPGQEEPILTRRVDEGIRGGGRGGEFYGTYTTADNFTYPVHGKMNELRAAVDNNPGSRGTFETPGGHSHNIR